MKAEIRRPDVDRYRWVLLDDDRRPVAMQPDTADTAAAAMADLDRVLAILRLEVAA